jgi:transcriptional regulator with XRE-family HTH domain
MQQLGVSQAQMIIRSGLSKAMVGELVRGSTVRHRSPRTLAAMSEALEWHHDHLESLLQGRIPPTPEGSESSKRLPARGIDRWEELTERLISIERRLVEIDRKINGQ